MEINYQETSEDLLTRIDIHEKFGTANMPSGRRSD